MSKGSDQDPLTEADKERLLAYLRTSHGTIRGDRKKITLTKKSTSDIKQAGASGKAHTIQVELRNRRTFINREEFVSGAAASYFLTGGDPARVSAEAQARAVVKAAALGRTFPDPFPPDCATAWGDDRFGLWFDLEIGGVTQRMRWIEPGTFWMGSDAADQERFHAKDDQWWRDLVKRESPRHLVTLTEGYWLADTACTQALWKAVVGDAPSHFKTDPELPVENVSWDDITDKFLPAAQREISDLTAALPTEAQWEYACRAVRESAYWFGDMITKEQANFESKATVPVKARPANGWGLYQMHGNVWEWCEGSLRKYERVPVENPPDGQDQNSRALRGGSWLDEAGLARSAYRGDSHRGNRRLQNFGFRFSLRSIKPDTMARPGLAEVPNAPGEFAQARQLYEATVAEQPGNVEARNGLAEVMTAQGDYAQARRLYDATLVEHPGNIVARNGLAALLATQGDYAQARQLYETTLAKHPRNLVARNGLARVLKAQGNFAQARRF